MQDFHLLVDCWTAETRSNTYRLSKGIYGFGMVWTLCARPVPLRVPTTPPILAVSPAVLGFVIALRLRWTQNQQKDQAGFTPAGSHNVFTRCLKLKKGVSPFAVASRPSFL